MVVQFTERKGHCMIIGENVKHWRERRAMSQEDLAKQAEVSPNTIWRLENENRMPRPSTLRKLATALNVDPGVLLDGKAAVVAN